MVGDRRLDLLHPFTQLHRDRLQSERCRRVGLTDTQADRPNLSHATDSRFV